VLCEIYSEATNGDGAYCHGRKYNSFEIIIIIIIIIIILLLLF